MKAILITEYYDDEDACSSLCKYDELPEEVKERVDKAIKSANKTIHVEYNSGLQYLYGLYSQDKSKKFFIQPGEKDIEFMCSIYFYTNY